MNTVSINGREYVPVNRQAAIGATDGVHYTPDMKLAEVVFDAPPHMILVPKHIQNLIGSKRGKITIVGLLIQGDTSTQLWLGKCVCGKYVTRKGYKWRKGLKEGKTDDGCPYCNKKNYQTKNATIKPNQYYYFDRA